MKYVNPVFDVDFYGDYLQSLVLYCLTILVVALCFLFIIGVVWVCACVTRKKEHGRTSKKAMNLAILLFFIAIVCFGLLGTSLTGNELINRGIRQSSSGMANINRNFKQATNNIIEINSTKAIAYQNVDHLIALVHKKINDKHLSNDTEIERIDKLLTNLSDGIERITEFSTKLTKTLKNVKFLEKVKLYGDRIEFERIISFCRKSKKGAVAFSAMGIIIFLLTFILLSIVFPATIAYADFCLDGNAYINEHVTSDMISAINFYSKCEKEPEKGNYPKVFELDKITEVIDKLRDSQFNLFTILSNNFPDDIEIEEKGKLINNDFSSIVQNVGSLETSLSCHTFSNSVADLKQGFCEDGLFGSFILLFGLVLLSIMLWILLLVISKSWNIFSRLGTDYVEVDEDDPFFPRTNDNIPVDIYGTHVFNPRTRFANSMDHEEPSTGTTTATGNVPINGGNATTPLLDGTERANAHWQRNLTTTSSLLASAPPATIGRDTSSHARVTNYSNNDATYHQYDKYQEQFDV
ncbi:Tweety family-containing protein [Strongyloides ratti]|uniref:Protein tweety homolog n=1 Tax=Strongyloides ratti TaxID=34506 RepID=A0A090MQE3_STRRB|nr:Tweety family-containing protein [Strongyloides ratti]CEF60388.1 Tweety family-containing protein [Strongyloides ratti]